MLLSTKQMSQFNQEDILCDKYQIIIYMNLDRHLERGSESDSRIWWKPQCFIYISADVCQSLEGSCLSLWRASSNPPHCTKSDVLRIIQHRSNISQLTLAEFHFPTSNFRTFINGLLHISGWTVDCVQFQSKVYRFHSWMRCTKPRTSLK